MKIFMKYQNILKYLFILFSINIFFLNSYFKEYLYTGSQSDLNSFVFRNIILFKENFIYAIVNYGSLGDANWPLSYIIHAYLNPFSNNISTYLMSSTLIGFMTFLITSMSLKNKSFNNLDSFAIASLILLLPWFNGRAHWGTSANLGWLFFSITIYFFTKLENNLNSNQIKNFFLIFFTSLFSALALYSRLSLSFFCIFFILTFFLSREKNINKFTLSLLYLIFSIPGFILIYIWGDIFYLTDNSTNSYHSYKNIFKNIPIILNYFFFYLWPIFFIDAKEKGLKIFLKENKIIFFLLFFIFVYLFFNHYFDYLSNLNYGGGVILKFGYMTGDKNNILFLLSSIIGASFIINFLKENFIRNGLLFLIIFIIYGFPKSLYQDYFEPLIFILFFCGLISSKKINLVKNKLILILSLYFAYFSTYNLSLILYKLNM